MFGFNYVIAQNVYSKPAMWLYLYLLNNYLYTVCVLVWHFHDGRRCDRNMSV